MSTIILVIMNSTGSFSSRNYGHCQSEHTSSSGENSMAGLLYSTLSPFPSANRARALDYDEIAEIDRGRFQIMDQPNSCIQTKNTVYLSHGNASSLKHPTLNLTDTYNLPEYKERDEKSDRCSSESRVFLLIVIVTMTTILLSAAAIAACLLLMFGIVKLPLLVPATPDPSSLSPTQGQNYCSCTVDLQFPADDLMQTLQLQVAVIQTEIENLRLKNPAMNMATQQRVNKLLVQVEAINKAVKLAVPMAQTPPTPDISGLALPAQISINMSTGCKQTTASAEINLYSHDWSYSKYFDETHVIVDITCELEMDGKPSHDGIGVVVSKTTSNSSKAFQYLSEVELQCRCYYWDPDQVQGNTGAYCRQVITKCPYKKQPYMDTVIIT